MYFRVLFLCLVRLSGAAEGLLKWMDLLARLCLFCLLLTFELGELQPLAGTLIGLLPSSLEGCISFMPSFKFILAGKVVVFPTHYAWSLLHDIVSILWRAFHLMRSST